MSRGPALLTMGRDEVEQYTPDGYVVCISITDPMSPPAKLSPDFRAALRLCFHDIDANVPSGVMTDCGPAQHMTSADAERAIAFVMEHREADTLVIHCEMGVSRSRSLAEALFDVFGRRAPNQWVYQRIVQEARREWDALPTRWIDFRWTPTRRGPRL